MLDKQLSLTHLSVPNNGNIPENLILLGAWCLANRVDLDHKKEKGLIEHPWYSNDQLDKDYAKIQQIYKLVLPQMRDYLNDLHGVNLSIRAWEIALGTWIRVFINCVFERHMLIDKAIKSYDIRFVHIANQSAVSEPPLTTESFIKGTHSPEWNELFAREIIRKGFPQLEEIPFDFPAEIKQEEVHNSSFRRTIVHVFKKAIKSILATIDELMVRNARIFLHRTGMGAINEFKFMFNAGFTPHMFLPTLTSPNVDVDTASRAKLDLNLDSSPVELLVTALAKQYLPSIFVENFQSTQELIDKRYPKRTEFIATGVSYYSDDYFKLFTAKAVDRGVKYGIIQHGGGFGTPKLNDEEELQLDTADFFFTWGWTQDKKEQHAKTIASSSFWLSTFSTVSSNPDGFIIMPVSEWTLQIFRIFSAPLSFRQLDYLDDIITFHHKLTPAVESNFRLRLQPNTRGWNVASRFATAGLTDAILPAPGRFIQDLPNARLAVVNANSTTLLECLFLNFPTVLILDPDMSPLRSEAKKIFDAMESANILHTTPESAAQFINEIFLDPLVWWQMPKTQSVRKHVVSHYARGNNKDLKKLRSYFLKQ